MKNKKVVKSMEEWYSNGNDLTDEEYNEYIGGEQLNSIKNIEKNIAAIKNILIFVFIVGFIGIIIHILNYMK